MTKAELLKLVDDLIDASNNLGASEERSDLMYHDPSLERAKKVLDKAKSDLLEVLEAIRVKEYKNL